MANKNNDNYENVNFKKYEKAISKKKGLKRKFRQQRRKNKSYY